MTWRVRRLRAAAVLAAFALVAGNRALGVGGSSLHKAYVSNTGDGTITVVDLDTMTAFGGPLNVGDGPRGSAVHPDASKIYIVNQQANDLMVFDTNTDDLITRTPVGGRPFRCGISPDGTSVYAACHTGHDVWRLNTADNTAAEVFFVAGGGMQDSQVSPDGTKVLAMNNNTGDVDFFGTADDQIIGSAIPVGPEPHSVAFSTDGNTAIVVGDNDTQFVDVATRTVVGSALANGQHEEVRIVGNLAYATNLSFLNPLPPPLAKPRAIVATPADGATTIDIFSMVSHTYLRSIVLGGLGANGLAISPDGHTAWVTMRLSNELREVDLVGEAETGRNLTVGAAPRSVSVVFKTPETPVVSYFLPRNINLKLKGAGKDSLIAAGFYDDGGPRPDYTQPVTIDVGGFTKTFTLLPKGKSFVAPKDPVVKFFILPSLRGSSRGRFKMQLKKASLTGLVDPDAPVEFHFRATGLPDCQGKVTLTAGRYTFGKKRGALVLPQFFPQRSAAKVGGAPGTDTLFFVGGFATNGQTPNALTGLVRFAYGPAYSRAIAGSLFKKAGDKFKYTEKVGKSVVFSMTFEFLRESVTVSAKKVELGDLSAATTNVVFDAAGIGAGTFRNTVKVAASGSKRFY